MSLSGTCRLRMARGRIGRAQRQRAFIGGRLAGLALLSLLVVLACAPAASAAGFRPTAFEDVDFVSKTVGWAVGSPGAVYATINGGQTWSQRPYGGNEWLTGIDFIDSKTGWVIGTVNEGLPAVILHTQDGGRHWVYQTNPTATDVFTDVKFANATTGCIVGRYGTILQTTNGGDTWVQVSSRTTSGLGSVVLRGSGVGYAFGSSGRMLKTADFGATWAPLPRVTTKDLRSASFVSSKKGWVVGAGGLILKTVNGGGSWVRQTSHTAQALAGVDFVDGSRGWAVGGKGTIVRTVDGGKSWFRQGSGTRAFLFAVDCRGARGWVVGELDRPLGSTPWAYGVIIATINGGAGWTRQF
jgi:photosystem II stability/assembly factor-like uncharacterized protein